MGFYSNTIFPRIINLVMSDKETTKTRKEVLADAPAVQRWQNRLNPIWGLIGDGCNLNRNIRELIQDCRFTFGRLDNFYMRGAPKFAGYMYQGVALKA